MILGTVTFYLNGAHQTCGAPGGQPVEAAQETVQETRSVSVAAPCRIVYLPWLRGRNVDTFATRMYC